MCGVYMCVCGGGGAWGGVCVCRVIYACGVVLVWVRVCVVLVGWYVCGVGVCVCSVCRVVCVCGDIYSLSVTVRSKIIGPWT